MTIDERLDALSQTVELIAAMQRHSIEETDRRSAETERRSAETDRKFAAITHNFEIVLDSIRSLERIATAHEQRIEDLEDKH